MPRDAYELADPQSVIGDTRDAATRGVPASSCNVLALALARLLLAVWQRKQADARPEEVAGPV
jgi:hypothetical protein